jgi:hypothetical protein
MTQKEKEKQHHQAQFIHTRKTEERNYVKTANTSLVNATLDWRKELQ